jgi:hypothetical protein
MKCPLCKGDIDEQSGKRLRKALGIIIVAAVVALVFFSLYSYWDASRPRWSDRDVLFPLPNTLIYSVHMDASEATGGIVAVYGNISNPSSLEDSWVFTHVSIGVFDGYNDTQFYFSPGVLYCGESVYFSWVYHFDRLNVSLCEVEVKAYGS